MVSRVERGPVADWMRTADRWLIGSFIALIQGFHLLKPFDGAPLVPGSMCEQETLVSAAMPAVATDQETLTDPQPAAFPRGQATKVEIHKRTFPLTPAPASSRSDARPAAPAGPLVEGSGGDCLVAFVAVIQVLDEFFRSDEGAAVEQVRECPGIFLGFGLHLTHSPVWQDAK